MFTPTPEQTSIIEFIRDHPSQSLMVDARAGSAKTSTIELAAKGVTTGPNLAVAFNKRIQQELEKRLPPAFDTKTLNGLGHGAWSAARGKRMEVDADKLFKLLKAMTADIPRLELQEDLFTEVLGLVRAAKSHGLVPSGAPRSAAPPVDDTDDNWERLGFDRGIDVTISGIAWARALLKESINQAYKGLIDFDDQIYMSVLFGGVFPKYHTVIVDEAQDLSPLNHSQLVKCATVRLIAVGDPYQAIYGFRGADSNSMTNLMEAFAHERLGLTHSFRVPHLISARQTGHVPDFKSHHTLHQGSVEHWKREWSVDEVPRDGFILCRNNAPLMRMAFTIIKCRRPVKVLGRDIGTSLANLLLKLTHKSILPAEELLPLVDQWETSELMKNADKESRLDTIRDRAESLRVLIDASEAPNSSGVVDFIKNLFSDKADGLTLSSGHKAKGLEKDWVLHLDPWRCPSKFAIRAARDGNPVPLIQERNLQYVIETRSKAALILADLEDCAERGDQ